MSKIVYLFGAGASYGTLPLVEEMEVWINDLIKFISTEEMSLSDKVSFPSPKVITFKFKREYQMDLIEDLKWLRDACKRHFSIDTYAKKLSIKHDPTLRKLKIVLSAFFELEQIINPPNPRYDYFFASLIDSIHDLPKKVRIISWNYDTQFERAFSEFSDRTTILENQSLLNVHNRRKMVETTDLNQFGIFKLNGSTELGSEFESFNSKTYYLNTDILHQLKIELLEKIVRMYAIAVSAQSIIPTLSFAWETSSMSDFMKIVNSETRDADILVIIGYSFPYFNRSIDKQIISEMKNLSKVYFQSPEAKQLIERFTAIKNDLNPDQLIPIFDKKYFYIPNEFQ
jgi:hypothetical protein